MSLPNYSGHPGDNDWYACGVCARVLDKHDTYPRGELVVVWEHTELDKALGADADHLVVPVHYSQMEQVKTVCDFCSTPDPVWELPVDSFEMAGFYPNGDAWGSTGNWLACQDCAEAINENAWSTLSRRGAEQVAAINGTDVNDELPTVRIKHYGVRKHKTGPLRRIEEG